MTHTSTTLEAVDLHQNQIMNLGRGIYRFAAVHWEIVKLLYSTFLILLLICPDFKLQY